ncbi:hypothetical protein [Candidatus Nanohalovita haloferacivicina]|uniref:hypothetical protein n=1 Tax=Candidatus Nanohalovita haloferacivicina TaxID=2978046 RepID=UPI00325FC755
MDKKSVFVGFMALFLFGAGSASVLASFGTISGTADVKSSLRITEIHWNESADPGYEYIIIENRAPKSIQVSNILVGDSGGTDEDGLQGATEIKSGQTATITGDEVSSTSLGSDLHLQVTDTAIADSGLNNGGETLYLKLNGNKIYEKTYSGDD